MENQTDHIGQSDTIVITKEILSSIRTPKGGVNSIQQFYMCKLFHSDKRDSGWLKNCIGRKLTRRQYDFVCALADNKSSKRAVRKFGNSDEFKRMSIEEVERKIAEIEPFFKSIKNAELPKSKYVERKSSGPIDGERSAFWKNRAVNKENYKAYLLSGGWRRFRKAIIELRGYQYQLCQATSDIHVHHMTYKRLGKEDLRDMLVVCGSCHGFVHREHWP